MTYFEFLLNVRAAIPSWGIHFQDFELVLQMAFFLNHNSKVLALRLRANDFEAKIVDKYNFIFPNNQNSIKENW